MLRRLEREELILFERHLLNLDKEAKRFRFKNGGAHSLIPTYVNSVRKGYYLTDHVIGKFEFDDEDDRIIGAVHVGIVNDVAELAFSVDQEFRSMGIGRSLFERGIELAKQEGASAIFTDCYVFNHSMMALARKFGIKIQRDGEDAEALTFISEIYPSLEEIMPFSRLGIAS